MTGRDPAGVPELPAALAARPHDTRRGLPIPPVNLHPGPDGALSAVDFTTINTTTSTDLAIGRRCSLCEESMGYWVNWAMLQEMQHVVESMFPGGGCFRRLILSIFGPCGH